MNYNVGNVVKFNTVKTGILYGTIIEEIKIVASNSIEREGCTFYVIKIFYGNSDTFNVKRADIIETYTKDE